MTQKITFSKFDLGIDLRKGASVSDANRLLEMTNAYVTTGLATRKRPGLTKVADLEPGTKGLFPAFGKLNTFYGAAAVTHANTLFKAHKVQYSGGVKAVRAVPFADVFNGFIYVCIEYDGGQTEHHYLDEPESWSANKSITLHDVRTPKTKNSLRYVAIKINAKEVVWTASKSYTVGSIVKPTTGSGFAYECEVAGTSGKTEPDFPTTSGQSINDGGVKWRCVAKGSTSAVEPLWPTTVGQIVVDGDIEWQAQSTNVFDANCPDTKAVVKIASKIFSVGSGIGDVVRFCMTGNPRVWTAPNDAGFLPTGLNSRGDRSTNALGIYQGKLVALSKDGAQVWVVDPDPTAMKLETIVENVGTSYPQTVENVAGDLYFLSDYGFRSITTLQYTNNLADVDVGSPIDRLVREETRVAGVNPKSYYFYGTGQYLCAIGNRMFVYSISRTAKIAAWSEYFLPQGVDDFAELNQQLYIRSGDAVFKLDDDVSMDDGSQYEVLVQLPYMDFKKPGDTKQIVGVDVVIEGQCYLSIGYDAKDPDAFTSEVKVKGNTRFGGMVSVECCGTEFSLRLRNYDDKPFQIDAITIFYNVLGDV